jgi:hypothetical protein
MTGMMQRGFVCLGVAGAALGGGCMADSGDEAIIVLKNVHVANEDCAPSAATSEAGWSHGSLDLLLPSSYVFVAQLKSRITADASQRDQRTIFTSGANVDISFPGSTLFSAAELAELRASGLTRYKDPFVATITPGDITDIPFQLIPEPLVERIIAKADLTTRFRLEAQATFTVVGEVSGGSVSSQAFSFAVTIGNGVAVNVTGACSALAAGFAANTGYACNPAQDGILDCCTSAGGLVCPAVAPTTPP